MNLSTPTEFQLKRVDAIRKDCRLAYLRPAIHFAKKVESVDCLNPNAKLCYEYDRIFRVTMEDGASIDVCNDYIRGSNGIKPGGWLVVEPGTHHFYFMEDLDFRLKYEL